jgi:2-haloacid dehalogenase
MSVHVFDAYGTLFDVHSAVRDLATRIGPRAHELTQIWRTKHLEYTWVRTLGGLPWRDFADLMSEALHTAMASVGIKDQALHADLVALYAKLKPYPEVRDALSSAKAGGARLAILSNGTKGLLASALAASGLTGVFESVLSVDDVRQFKSAPAVYAMVHTAMAARADDITFYSSNRWDIAAARTTGWRAIWVNRTLAPDEYSDLPPHEVWSDLARLAV